MRKKNIFIRILAYILPYKKQFILGSIFAFFFSISNGLTLYSVVPIFDTLSPGDQKYSIELNDDEVKLLENRQVDSLSEKIQSVKASLKLRINDLLKGIDKFDIIVYIFIFLLFLVTVRIVLKLMSVYYIGFAGYGAIRDIRKSLYNSILHLPVSFFHRKKTGDLISKIIYSTDLISGALSNQLRKFVINVFLVITHIGILLYLNINLTLMALIVLAIITIPILSMGKAFRRYTKIEQDRVSELSSITHETIDGIKIIKSFQMEDYQIKRYKKNAYALFIKKIKKAVIDIARPHIIEIIASVFVVFLFIYGGRRIISGEYTTGQFLFFVLTFLFIMNPVKQIANMNNQIKQAEAAGEMLFEIIDTEKEPVDYPDSGKPGKKITVDKKPAFIIPQNDIKFNGISFKYPSTEKYVLKDIDFSAKAGTKTAIVGRSGAGKTTLVDLAARFYEPSNGKILFDDIDIKSIPLSTIRNSTGIVTQENFLFKGSIAENISYGDKSTSMDLIIEAAKSANAHDFIMKMPGQYEATIGEKGKTLSGGERQRIAIARAILRNPPVLILDEATSSLDTESEKLVQSALEKLMENRTCFIIAHRLSTIVNSDMIVVLNDASIAETGNHEELLAANGIYKNLYDIQFNTKNG